jgi:hypothetical protein
LFPLEFDDIKIEEWAMPLLDFAAVSFAIFSFLLQFGYNLSKENLEWHT